MQNQAEAKSTGTNEDYIPMIGDVFAIDGIAHSREQSSASAITTCMEYINSLFGGTISEFEYYKWLNISPESGRT